MNPEEPRGLTKVIYESLLTMSPEVIANGRGWTRTDLDLVAKAVLRRITDSGRRQRPMVFDWLYQRSFKEATRLLEQTMGTKLREPAWPAGRRLGASA